ncbi:MAG: putative FtsK/SpoIIIE family protein [Acidimicrobiales bacterium]|nr:putative FtsK/SpoIIIE family protein [Acidimicrobiales bacterium]
MHDLATPTTDPSNDHADAALEAVWITGPDAGGAVPLPTGSHIIGRSPTAPIRCEDADLELHHAVLTIRHGVIRLDQLTGARPLLLDGTPVDGTRVELGQRMGIGSSVLVVRAADSVAAPPRAAISEAVADQLGRVPFARAPRAIVAFAPDDIVVPLLATPPGGLGGGLLPTLLGVGGAGLMALLFHQVMFLLFGLMGAVVAVGTWIAQRIGVVRSRSNVRIANERATAEFADLLDGQRDQAAAALRAGVTPIDRAVWMMVRRAPGLWAVRGGDPDAFRVSLGETEGYWQPNVVGMGNASPDALTAVDAATRLGLVPAVASLAAGTVTALVGGREATAVARSMLVQLAASIGPADWRLAIVSDRAVEWNALSTLAHIRDASGSARLVATADVDAMIGALDERDGRPLVIVVDGSHLLTTRTSALRRLLADDSVPTTCIVLCAAQTDVPAMATSALLTSRDGIGRWAADTRVCALAERVQIAGISAARAAECAESIGALVDPEQIDAASHLPTEVGLLDLLRASLGTDGDAELLDPARIAERWSTAGIDPRPRAPLGVAADGVVDVDLVRDGPHALLAGTTGAGKSELLRSLVIGLATASSPDAISFVLIDYKGGSTFDACVGLPHVVGVVTDLDDRLAARALRSLHAELRRREQLLRDAGVSDLTAYRSAQTIGDGSVVIPRLVVIVDEFATLAVQLPDFMSALLGIAQRGRSLGVHLVLATQRPSGVISDDIRANTNLRIALRVQDGADAMDVIGDASAAAIPRSVPGRAVMRLGADEIVAFQTAHCATELSPIVDAVRQAWQRTGMSAPHRPWQAPLGSDMTADDLPSATAGVVGIIDDPDQQRRCALTWAADDGHLLLAGAPGTGTTTALLALAINVDRSEPTAQLFVIDALGDPQLDDLERLACHVATVRTHRRERLMRVLDHLCREITERKASTGASRGDAGIVVLIDGYASLRAELEADELWDQLAALDVIVAEGVAVGVRVAITTTRCGAVPNRLMSSIAARWVFNLADPTDAAIVGAGVRSVPPAIAGRLFDVRSGCEAQIVVASIPTAPAGTVAPRPVHTMTIGELPSSIDTDSLPHPVTSGPDLLAPVGIGFDLLQPAVLPVAAGEHVLVIGPPRTGRSTALRTIAAQWQRAHRDGWVGCVAPRRSCARVGSVFADIAELLAAAPADRPVLVAVDDAELVDDAGGSLAARIALRADGFTVVAAGRPESLRASYGHWTTAVRRSRLGIVMAAANELDADLLGAVLPRRLPIAVRPGLAWLVAEGERHLVQLAHPGSASAEPAPPISGAFAGIEAFAAAG